MYYRLGVSKQLLICLLLWSFPVVSASAQPANAGEWETWLLIDGLEAEALEQGAKSAAESPPHLTAWTRLALNLIVKYERNAVRATRLLGYLHVSMHDALVVAKRAGLSDDEAVVAAHLAAAGTMAYFFPTEPTGRFDQHSIDLLSVSYPADWPSRMDSKSASRKVADRVLSALIIRARSDGAEMVWPLSARPESFPGMYEEHPPLFAYNPLEVLAGQWTPWVEKDGLELEVNPPTEFGSDQFNKELDEVIAVSKTLTPRQREIAEEWHLDAGSVTPAGIWNHRALGWADQYELSQFATIRFLTILNIAMSDATIHCWEVKYRWWTMRPITAAHLRGDTDFVPALATPAHPSYVSGHGAISGAAASVVVAYLPEAGSTAVEMASDASMSRLFGGIHFRSDNENGLRLGKLVGAKVLGKADGG